MDIKPEVDPAVFDASIFAAVQRLLPAERVHAYLLELDQEQSALVASAGTETSLETQAHKIVSKAGMLGLTRMSDCARVLENACRSGAGRAAALQQFRAAAGDVRLFALPATERSAD